MQTDVLQLSTNLQHSLHVARVNEVFPHPHLKRTLELSHRGACERFQSHDLANLVLLGCLIRLIYFEQQYVIALVRMELASCSKNSLSLHEAGMLQGVGDRGPHLPDHAE